MNIDKNEVKAILDTLNTVEVKGKDNLNKLFAIISLLEMRLADEQKKDEAQE